MAQNITLPANSVHVTRSADWLALLVGCENYAVQPGAKVVVLPDAATAQDIIAAISALMPPPPLPPMA
jgi:hypothetical protein